jgi:hypothetical protein
MRSLLPVLIASACVLGGCSDTTPPTAVTPAPAPATVTTSAPSDTATSKPAAADAPIPVKEGFVTKVVDKRLWVFRAGSPELSEFEKTGDVGKQAMRVGAGPNRMTVKGPDLDTIDDYLKATAK